MDRVAAAVERETGGDGHLELAIGSADVDLQSADDAAAEQRAEQQAAEVAGIIDRGGEVAVLEDQAGRIARPGEIALDGSAERLPPSSWLGHSLFIACSPWAVGLLGLGPDRA